MIPTPEAISRLLQEEIRQGVLLHAHAEGPRRRSRAWELWTSLKMVVTRDWIRTGLVLVGVLTFATAVAFLVSSWPLGGGMDVSEAAIAQGASLIFVVILLGLLAPAVEAGRSIGWDASWIRNDAMTWLSMALVSGISLFLLWLGSLRPDRPEEVATIFFTATGLVVTALVARRMLGFADPATQLAERRQREAKTIAQLIEGAAEESRSALSLAGVDEGVAAPIVGYPSRQVQVQAAESIKRVLSTSRMAWHRREWVLAAQAHVQAILLAMQYAESVGALSSDDRVFELIRNESDDLHEMAGGPEGRWFSLTVLQNLIECGLGVVSTEKASMPHQESDQLAHYFAMTTESLVKRRLGDEKSQDIYAGLDGIKRLALAEVAHGHPWGAASIAQLGLKWAPIGVEAGMAHLAWPAWSCGMEVLKALALVEDAEGLALRSLCDGFISALSKVSRVPHRLTNGLEPIIGHWVAESTLVGLGYVVWRAPENRLEDVARLTRGVSFQIVRLVSQTENNWQRASSKSGGDVLYHLIAARVARVQESNLSDHPLAIVDEGIGGGLGLLRQMVVDEGEVPEHYATRDLLHIYFSAWQLALFAVRNRNDLPDDLRAEHEEFMAALVDDALADLPTDLIVEGLGRLSSWLDQEGYVDLAVRTKEKQDSVAQPLVGPSPFADLGWGFGGNYHTYRGSMMGGLFNRVEAHFADRI